MKPIFISKNKIYYSLMIVICLSIIVLGTIYNHPNKKSKVSSKDTISTIAQKPKPVVKKDSMLGKKTISSKKEKSKLETKDTLAPKSKSDSKNTALKMTVKKIENEIKEVEKSFVAGISEDIFDNISIDRDRTRDRQIELLREIINNPQSDKETRKKAQTELLFITKNLEIELETENILKANGYKDSIVFIQETGITVLMKKVPKNKEEVNKIKEIVSISTDFKADKVSLLGQGN